MVNDWWMIGCSKVCRKYFMNPICFIKDNGRYVVTLILRYSLLLLLASPQVGYYQDIWGYGDRWNICQWLVDDWMKQNISKMLHESHWFYTGLWSLCCEPNLEIFPAAASGFFPSRHYGKLRILENTFLIQTIAGPNCPVYITDSNST